MCFCGVDGSHTYQFPCLSSGSPLRRVRLPRAHLTLSDRPDSQYSSCLFIHLPLAFSRNGPTHRIQFMSHKISRAAGMALVFQPQAADFSISFRPRAHWPLLTASSSELARSLVYFLAVLFSGNSSGRQWGNKEEWIQSTFWCWENPSPGDKSSLGVGWEEKERNKLFNQLLGWRKLLQILAETDKSLSHRLHMSISFCCGVRPFFKVDLQIYFVHLQGVYIANLPHPSKVSIITLPGKSTKSIEQAKRWSSL